MIEISRLANRNFQLRCQIRLPAHIEKVFSFFADANNLERLTPGWLHFSVLTPGPVIMRCGALIDYKLRIHGIPLRWQSRISRWEPPNCFADEQIRGPYRRWYHLHRFEADGDETICLDEVEYSFVGGPLINRLFVQRDLKKIFEYRAKVLGETFTRNTIDHTGKAEASSPIH